jgi:outer membrane protein assembly factor BamE (lipoprotein component of BamABCDE complex)
MMKILLKRLCFTAAMLGVLSGCATPFPGMKDWSTLREADFRALRPGQATKEDVIKALGMPYQQMRFPSQSEEVWDYLYPDQSFTMLAWVYFDERGVYKRYAAQLHPGIYSGAGQ